MLLLYIATEKCIHSRFALIFLKRHARDVRGVELVENTRTYMSFFDRSATIKSRISKTDEVVSGELAEILRYI